MGEIYTAIKTIRVSVTEVGALSAAVWSWAGRGAGWISCCGQCNADGWGTTGCTALVSYNGKLRMQTLRDQGFGAKAVAAKNDGS